MSFKHRENTAAPADDTEIERQVFSAARKLSGSTRTDYLNQTCGDNEKLLRRVEKLLEACDVDSGLLDRDFKSVYFELSDSGELKSGSASESKVDAVLALLEPPNEGEDILGRVTHYEIRALIGRGAFGVVFKAFDNKLERLVAIKVLSPALSTIPGYRKRFLHEARAAASIQHDNVVRIHDVEESPFPFIVMELINGDTLQSYIRKTGPLPTAEVLDLSIQVIKGLDAAHRQGIVHLDVKPANIMLHGVSPNETRAKLTDFGLALAVDDAGAVVPEVVLGTPAYMSPEQAKGGSIDHRADLFSFGSVIYAMCSGKPAFSGNETMSVMRGVMETERVELPEGVRITGGLSAIINRLHSFLPDSRYGSANEVHRDLLRLSQSKLERIKSNPWPVALASVAVLALFAWFMLSGAGASAPGVGKSNPTWADARQQMLEVNRRQVELDSGYNIRDCRYEIVDGYVADVEYPLTNDNSPLGSLTDLEKLHITNYSHRTDCLDLSFASGMTQLHTLKLGYVDFESFEPLRGLPIEKLDFWNYFEDKPNQRRNVDLAPLDGMPLRWINCGGHNIENLDALAGCPLESVNINFTDVADLSVFKGMPLHTLQMRAIPATDLSPLKDVPLKILEISSSSATELSPLSGMELEALHMHDMGGTDLSALKDCRIKTLWMDYESRHKDLVKSIPGLELLNEKPVDEFIESFEASEREQND